MWGCQVERARLASEDVDTPIVTPSDISSASSRRYSLQDERHYGQEERQYSPGERQYSLEDVAL